MISSRFIRLLLSFIVMVVAQPLHRFSAHNLEGPQTNVQRPAARDGQHDFDFEIGKWKTHLRRLLRPLTGSTTWVEYEGTTVVRLEWQPVEPKRRSRRIISSEPAP